MTLLLLGVSITSTAINPLANKKNNQTIKVAYEGILPDLFREGQGVVASGSIKKECKKAWAGKLCTYKFSAKEVLAKHDENYMPPEVAAALEISSSQQ